MAKSRENFVRLAQARTNRVIDGLRLIGNLSSRSNYVWTDDDVRKIFSVIEAEVRATKQRFATSKKKESDDPFTLDD